MTRITRVLNNDAGQSAVIFIEYPRERIPGSPEWVCTVGMEALAANVVDHISGLGEMQALYLGMIRLDAIVNIANDSLEDRVKWFWEGGVNRSDFGLPKAYPDDPSL